MACEGVCRERPADRPRAPDQEDRKTEVEAQIELGRLLELARSGRNRDSGVTVAELLDAYVPVAGWELDNLYARLQKCGDLACAGKPFTEHRHVPDLRPGPADPRNGWQQAATKFREAIACGAPAPGDDLPLVSELARLQGLKPGTIQHAFLELAKEGLLVIRHGRTAQVAGDAPAESNPPRGIGPPGPVRATTARCLAASRTSAAR